ATDRLTREPPARGVGPFEASTVAREVTAQAHRVDEDGSGRVAAELTGGSQRGHLLHEPVSLAEPPFVHEEQRAAHHRPRAEVRVARALADPRCPINQSQ